ncbi:hypothetical protein [Actinomadura sp. 6N118]|uniref:hypothetical protein n=1 Tax=Actinomadura sp. 6N118 TaxID=3375151 RepID=UPI0037A59948
MIATAFDQATARDGAHARTWVVLVDGDPRQIRLLQAEAKRRSVSIHIVLDLIHVLEYCWRAARCLHTADDTAAEQHLTNADMSAGGWDMTAPSIGGHPEWIDDAQYPTCPICARAMDYIGLEEAQDPEGDPIAEGTTYLFLDASCGLAATIYQQT